MSLIFFQSILFDVITIFYIIYLNLFHLNNDIINIGIKVMVNRISPIHLKQFIGKLVKD
jgi:hypothetical protein